MKSNSITRMVQKRTNAGVDVSFKLPFRIDEDGEARLLKKGESAQFEVKCKNLSAAQIDGLQQTAIGQAEAAGVTNQVRQSSTYADFLALAILISISRNLVYFAEEGRELSTELFQELVENLGPLVSRKTAESFMTARDELLSAGSKDFLDQGSETPSESASA